MHGVKLFAALPRSLAILLFSSAGYAQVIFSDNFNSGASAQWGNELGGWFAAGGVYDAAAPNNSPATYTLLPDILTDFSVTVTINNIKDGGIWLRAVDNNNAIVLVTGGHTGTGTGLYWHEVNGGSVSGPLIEVSGLFVSGASTADITVTVVGNTYSAFVNGSSVPATTLTSTLFSSGKVGLYDFSSQTFDNFSVSAIPEPSVSALGAALAALGVARLVRRRRAA
jgi:hypothetical protein